MRDIRRSPSRRCQPGDPGHNSADVDHQSILDRVRVHDNAGRRRILLRSPIHQAPVMTAGQDDLGGRPPTPSPGADRAARSDIVFGKRPRRLRTTRAGLRQPVWHLAGTPWTHLFDEDGFTIADGAQPPRPADDRRRSELPSVWRPLVLHRRRDGGLRHPGQTRLVAPLTR